MLVMKTTLHLCFIVVLFSSYSAFSQDGSLDTTFDDDGKVLTPFGSYKSAINAVAMQSDGKIVAAGAAYNNGSYNQLALARYNTDGSLDASFGVGGKVVSDYPDIKLSLCSIFLQDDGKIVGGGIIYNNYVDSQFIMVRYHTDGSLDTTFGTDGLVITDNIMINALKPQPDGKILAAGFTFENPDDKDFLLIRYNQDGTPDTTFGVNGRTTSTIGNRDFANALCLQTDGKIILAGTTYTVGYENNFCVMRYDSDGALDTTFGINGLVIIDNAPNEEATSVMVQPDGKIVFTGWFGDSATASYAVARMLSDGSLDSGFGTAGMVTGSDSGKAKSCQLQNDGKMIFSGSFQIDGSHNIALTRIGSDGAVDTTFGDNGVVITPFESSCKGNALVLQADSKIIVGGEAGPTGGSYNPDFALLRYNSAAALSVTETKDLKDSYSVYPNPVGAILNFESTLVNAKMLQIELYDVNGKKVQTLLDATDFASGFSSQELVLPDTLSKGLYFLAVNDGMNISRIKIIK
jgi:uncharacterized delta-60 repeat protein